MPAATKPVVLELLYRALHEPPGVVVETDNLTRLRADCYKVRKENPGEGFDALTFLVHPMAPDSTLVILNTGAE